MEINGSPVARGYWILLRATGFQKVIARQATGFQASLYTRNIYLYDFHDFSLKNGSQLRRSHFVKNALYFGSRLRRFETDLLM